MAKLLYFASLRETLNSDGESLPLDDGITSLGQLKLHLAARGSVWQQAFGAQQGLLGAVNQQMAQDDTPITDADEIAFFPPVTGG